ncbi:MAG: hypothetical protein COB51_01915 [Moraxellaceae bacterium]|nr:MAG: hypothetical protein COB51_01915 [Moraxellaceae bacterium]
MSNNNPYLPPSSTDSAALPNATPQRLADLPNRCSWGSGFSWIKEGGALFFKAPGYLFTTFIIYFVVIITISMIPLVSILTQVFGPMLTAGLYYICMTLDTQDQRKYRFLFIGFQQKVKPLLALALIYILGIIAIVAVVGITMALLVGVDQLNADQLSRFSSPDAIANNPPDPILLVYFMLAILMGVVLILPLTMGIWFSPALIMLNDLPARQAFVTSFKGCSKNVGSLTVWGVGMLAITVVAMIPLGLGLLFLPAISLCSLYISYKAIFLKPSDDEPE